MPCSKSICAAMPLPYVSVPENERPEVHTGKIAIKKVGEKADGTPLKDVEFMIFDSTEKAQAAVKLLQNNKAGEITGALKVYDPNLIRIKRNLLQL